MTNLLSNKQIKMKHYLLSEQDIEEIYWAFELLISVVLEKLSEKEIKEED